MDEVALGRDGGRLSHGCARGPVAHELLVDRGSEPPGGESEPSTSSPPRRQRRVARSHAAERVGCSAATTSGRRTRRRCCTATASRAAGSRRGGGVRAVNLGARPAPSPAWPKSAAPPWLPTWATLRAPSAAANSAPHRPGPQGLRDRRHRPQGPAPVQGRVVAAAHHHGPPWSAPPTTPAESIRSSPASATASTTCRWSNVARITSASSPPTSPNEPGRSCDEGCPTSSATPTDSQSAPDRPGRSSPSTGPFPPTCAPGAGARRWGRPLNKCSRHMQRQALEAPADEATSPDRHRRWPPAITSTDEPLDSRSSRGNQPRPPRLTSYSRSPIDSMTRVGR
jgi:hypothetical protein